MMSASTSRVAARISATVSPRRTFVVTRTPVARRPTATDSRYLSASRRSFTTSPTYTARAPSIITGGGGPRTRSSTPSMSSGPAISRMNGTIASASIEPSSGTSARLYTSGSLRLRGAPRHIHRGVTGTDDQNRGRRAAQDRLRDASQDEPAEAAAAVSAHHDQVYFMDGRGLDDRGGGRAIPHVRLHAGDAVVGEALDHSVEIFFRLAHHRDLGRDRVAGQRGCFRRAKKADRGRVSRRELARGRQGCFGQHRSV